jgi:hypothetical protein
VFEYIAKGTCKEMTQILKEHRDGKLESVRKNMFKETPGTSTRTAQERKTERAERKKTGCTVTNHQTYC